MKTMKPLAPKDPPPWAIKPSIIQKEETARAKFVDVGIELLKRVQAVSGYEDALLVKLEIACALSEMPEEQAARAWVSLVQNPLGAQTYN